MHFKELKFATYKAIIYIILFPYYELEAYVFAFSMVHIIELTDLDATSVI